MITTTIRLYSPLTDKDTENLSAGDRVLLNGTIYTARDAAHKRLVESLEKGEALPEYLRGAVIFYAGPTPARPGEIAGSVGPTTAIRMDRYAIPLMEKAGLKASIGKGVRSNAFRKACKTYKSIYFAAAGGIAALLNRHIISCEVVDFEDLGPEAIRRYEIKDFPVLVANDTEGLDIFEISRKKFGRSAEDILKDI